MPRARRRALAGRVERAGEPAARRRRWPPTSDLDRGMRAAPPLVGLEVRERRDLAADQQLAADARARRRAPVLGARDGLAPPRTSSDRRRVRRRQSRRPPDRRRGPRSALRRAARARPPCRCARRGPARAGSPAPRSGGPPGRAARPRRAPRRAPARAPRRPSTATAAATASGTRPPSAAASAAAASAAAAARPVRRAGRRRARTGRGGAGGGGPCRATPPPSSERHLLAQRRQPLVADPRDLAELLDRAEAAELLAVVEDLLRGQRPDPAQRVELLERRGVEVRAAARARARAPARRATVAGPPPRTRSGTSTWRPSSSSAARFSPPRSARRGRAARPRHRVVDAGARAQACRRPDRAPRRRRGRRAGRRPRPPRPRSAPPQRRAAAATLSSPPRRSWLSPSSSITTTPATQSASWRGREIGHAAEARRRRVTDQPRIVTIVCRFGALIARRLSARRSSRASPARRSTLTTSLPSMCACTRGRARASDSSSSRSAPGGAAIAVAQLAVDLQRDLDLVALQQRRVGDGPRLLPHARAREHLVHVGARRAGRTGRSARRRSRSRSAGSPRPPARAARSTR